MWRYHLSMVLVKLANVITGNRLSALITQYELSAENTESSVNRLHDRVRSCNSLDEVQGVIEVFVEEFHEDRAQLEEAAVEWIGFKQGPKSQLRWWAENIIGVAAIITVWYFICVGVMA